MTSAFPIAFQENFVKQFGQNAWLDWLRACASTPPVSIRLHPDKKIQEEKEWSNIPWNPQGRYLPQRPVFTLDPLFHAGCYYVQEAASQFLWEVLTQCSNSNHKIKILDLCGAPGGKSSLAAEFLQHEGLLVSNEIIKNRAYILKANMEKTGYNNVIVTQNDPKDFAQLTGFFDIIILDAPCSGEGMFRKDKKAIDEWTEDHVVFCSARQKRIIGDIAPALKSGGFIIYSTCTLNDSENIENIDWACQNLPFISIPIAGAKTHSIPQIHGKTSVGYQFSPHTHKTEGLFISLLQKQGEEKANLPKKRKSPEIPNKKTIEILNQCWNKPNGKFYFTDPNGDIHTTPETHKEEIDILLSSTRVIHAGINMGTFKQNQWVPHHSLALATGLSDYFHRAELTKDDALAFLNKSLQVVDSESKGWLLASYRSHGLGWIKNLGNRINNYLPNEARIRMDIKNSDLTEE